MAAKSPNASNRHLTPDVVWELMYDSSPYRLQHALQCPAQHASCLARRIVDSDAKHAMIYRDLTIVTFARSDSQLMILSPQIEDQRLHSNERSRYRGYKECTDESTPHFQGSYSSQSEYPKLGKCQHRQRPRVWVIDDANSPAIRSSIHLRGTEYSFTFIIE